jgi:hypothetical protein
LIFETHRKVGFFMAATLAGRIIFSCGFFSRAVDR